MGPHGGHPSLKRIAANNVLRAVYRSAVPLGGLQSLAAAEPIKTHHRAHALVRQTKLASISAAPRDRTPSRSRSRLHRSFLTIVYPGGTGSVVLTGKIADTCSDTSLTGG